MLNAPVGGHQKNILVVLSLPHVRSSALEVYNGHREAFASKICNHKPQSFTPEATHFTPKATDPVAKVNPFVDFQFSTLGTPKRGVTPSSPRCTPH